MTSPMIQQDPGMNPSPSARGDLALEHQRPAMLALDVRDIRQINVDIALAVSRALGVLPAIDANRAAIRRDLPNVDMSLIDQMEERALALSAINSDYETAATPPAGLMAYVAETFESRTVLLSVAKMLITCNYIKEDRIAKLNGGHGYREAADDTLALIAVLNNNWSVLEGKVPLTRAVLDHAQAVAETQLELLGIREQQPVHISELSDLRSRAFTLLDKSYEEFRRAILFLRHYEGDADLIVPPLRLRGPRNKDEEKPTDTKTQPTTTTAPATGTTSTPGTAPGTAPGTGTPLPADKDPSGLPRTSPFTA